MRIASVRIQNFRSFSDETIFLTDYNCLIGGNGSGKTTVLNALNVFFRQSKDCKTDFNHLTIEDFHHKDTTEPIRITVTFENLSEQARRDLSDYVRQGTLIVSAVARFDPQLGRAEVKQYGNRLGFEEFRGFFEAIKGGQKVDELKRLFADLRKTFSDIPAAATKPAMETALREYEAAHPTSCVLIPSEDQFYGVSKGANRLSPHIQWVFVSASKDILEESEETKTSALGQLLERTVRSKVQFSAKLKNLKEKIQEEYQSILESEQPVLNELSTALESRLESWAHPGITAQVRWRQEPDKAVKIDEPWASLQIGERGFEGDLVRFGLGLQRSYMLALLQELTVSADPDAPTLVMAIEEPEIYQHPPQVRYMAETLFDLAGNNAQLLLCSHHPAFIPSDDVESVRLIRETGNPSHSVVSSLSYAQLAEMLKDAGGPPLKQQGMIAKLYPTLRPVINEMFFCNVLILVEGYEDLAYIATYLMLTENYRAFRRSRCHIVPVGGKSELIKPLAIASALGIPVFVVFDADTDKVKENEIALAKKDNFSIQKLIRRENIEAWPSDHIMESNCAIWKHNIGEAIQAEFGDQWEKHKNKAESFYGNPGGLSKNPLLIAHILEGAWQEGTRSELLRRLAENIIAFADGTKHR